MKKMFLITGILLSIGAVSFARGGHYGGGCGGYGNGHMYDNNGTYTYDAKTEAEMIAMQEKRLELRKELIKTKPDWSKVEKLNQDLAKMQASLRTESMKRYRSTDSVK